MYMIMTVNNYEYEYEYEYGCGHLWTLVNYYLARKAFCRQQLA